MRETVYSIGFELGARTISVFAQTSTRIVVARHGPDGPATVAWLAWQPTVSDTVAWDDAYGLYAAEPALRDGSILPVRWALPHARDRCVYPFDGTAFGAPRRAAKVLPGHYDVRNVSSEPVAFGLLQRAIINETVRSSPLNAVVVPPSFGADFIALTSASVWMQAGAESGSIVRVPPGAAVITFSREARTAVCRYDERSSSFVSYRGPCPD